MNRLSPDRQAAIVRCLVEGNSIRSTVRLTGAAEEALHRKHIRRHGRLPKYTQRT